MASRAAAPERDSLAQSLWLARFVLLFLLIFSLFLFQILLTYIPAVESTCSLRDTRPKRTGHKRGSSFFFGGGGGGGGAQSRNFYRARDF